MLMLDYITDGEYKSALPNEIKIANNINLYDTEANIYRISKTRSNNRYGLNAYKD